MSTAANRRRRMSLLRWARHSSRAADRALASFEGRLPHPQGWTTARLRTTSTPAGEATDLGIRFRRRIWRVYWQARVIWTFVAVVGAFQVNRTVLHGALLVPIAVGIALLVIWVGLTTLWSSYLYAQILEHPAWSYVEVAISILLLGLGGGANSAFVAYAGIAMACPAFALGTRHVVYALAGFLAAFAFWAWWWQTVGHDPRLSSGYPIETLLENAFGYVAFAVIVATAVYALNRLERLGSLEQQLETAEDRQWMLDIIEAADHLRAARMELDRPLHDYGTAAKRFTNESPRGRAGEILVAVDQLDLARETHVPERSLLREVLDDARFAIARENMSRISDEARAVITYEPDEHSGRLRLREDQAELLHEFALAAAVNMAEYGRPPWQVRATVEWGADDDPMSHSRAEIVFSNRLKSSLQRALPRQQGRGYGIPRLRQIAEDLGVFIHESDAAFWHVGVRFVVAPSSPARSLADTRSPDAKRYA
jgi:hypothetical protein